MILEYVLTDQHARRPQRADSAAKTSHAPLHIRRPQGAVNVAKTSRRPLDHRRRHRRRGAIYWHTLQLWAACGVNGDFEKTFARIFQLLYTFQTRLRKRNADVAQLVEQRSRKA